MNEWVSLAIGALVGAILSVVISRYYYFKQVDKKLAVYIHLASPVLKGTDPIIRRSLKIQYQNQEVDDLFDLQLIIANEGFRPVRNYVEPLSFNIPNSIKVLDTSILYVKPAEKNVSVNIIESSNQAKKVEFHFPILNSGDFFLVKILLDGVINTKDLVFKITDEDLPSSIIPEIWPTVRIAPGQDTETKERKPSKLNLIVSILFFFLGIIFSFSALVFHDSMFPFSSLQFINILALITFLTLLVLTVSSFAFAILLLTSMFNLERKLARRKFNLPDMIR